MKHTLPALLLLLGWAAGAGAEDWAGWRGPEQNGVSRDTGLPEKFDVLWKTPIGGRTTPIIQKGRIYLINKTGSGKTLQERVMCFNEADGKMLWEHKFNVWLTGIVEDRLGWTSLVGDPETDTIFAHGTQGLFFCFDHTGKILWSHSLTEEFGRISGYGGRVTNPIVDGDRVILGLINASWGQQASGRNRFVAFDKRTGKIIWWGSTGLQPKNTYFSTPVVAVINGERLIISGGGDGGVHAFKAYTGEKVWSYPIGPEDINCSPVVDGNLVYIGQGEPNLVGDTQGCVVCLDASQVTKGAPKEVWRVDGIKVKFASPIFDKANKRLYVCNEIGVLYCLDPANGAVRWKKKYGKNTMGSPVLADGKVYVGEVGGKFSILKPGADSCEVLHQEQFESEINGSPAIANGHVYIMNSEELFCLGTKDGKAGKAPAPIKNGPTGKTPAHVAVYPADVTLHPGEKVALLARAFDDHGQFIEEVKVDWELASPLPPEGITPPPPVGPPLKGELSEKSGKMTTFTAAAVPPGQGGRVLAKLGSLTGWARVRVAPKLPYKADFSKLPEKAAPAGWVNTQGKFLAKKVGGEMVLSKRNDVGSPLVARAHGYITTPEATNYTIEAEIQGTQKGADLPDFGVSANRYTLMLSGNSKSLTLSTWDALPRLIEAKPFVMDKDVWYRFKLTCEVDAGGKKATVRGKVWKSSDPEPKDWTLELTDDTPNTEGSAAIYGLSTNVGGPASPGTDIYYRNVSVTPNKK
jgi:outer membrane protein assembly factor BamB